ncbi:toprim domain-containing protein, partial [Erwinia mallotivora]|uniref:toprim domain-containing protein n=1 Tax=Erwinia mallotivora TaxID=69222 RepID=UPI0035EA32A8
LVSHFRLGFAGAHGVAGALPSPDCKAGKALRTRLKQLGVIRESNRQDHFRGCLMVPVVGWSESYDPAQRGRVLQLYGRRTMADHLVLKGSAKHLYLPSPLAGIWNEGALKASDEVILCEALIDAMTFWCAGYRNVISAFGVNGFNGFTVSHLAALQYHGVKRVLIAFDRDEAGDRGAEAVASELHSAGIDVWRVRFPAGLDANAYVVKSGNPESALALALEQSVRMAAVVGSAGPLQSDAAVTAETVTDSNETRPSLAALPDVQTATGAAASAASAAVACEVTPAGELLLHSGPRVWRVRGWQKNQLPEVMKVNVQVLDESTGAFHVDSFDMYHAKQRQGFVSTAANELACELAVIKREAGRVLLALEQQQDVQRRTTEAEQASGAVSVSGDDEQAALALLKDPQLAERIVSDLASCGVVGESANLLTGYLAATSRKLDKPLAVLIQSSSAAGKSSLMDAVLSLIPEEERIQYSAMTGQSLYYLGETSLQHKILAIAEEEGVRQAAYALKLLQSDGELKIASTGKDESSGDLVTREYSVQGPVMLMLTTTASDVDEELLNRCLVLTVNESQQQTEAIHAAQRKAQTLAGLLASSEKQYLTKLHQNAQRLLRPLKVVNPYAEQLTFLSDKTRTRRDHMKYLTLIQAVALLHQYQREVKRAEHRGQVIEYIEVQPSDITLANKLAHEVLGRTLDEMPPQTRKLLVLLKEMVAGMATAQNCQPSEVRFTRRDVRERLHWSDSQLKHHCLRLVEMEYLLVHGGSRGQLMQYQLLWDGGDGEEAHLCGLLNVDEHKGSERKFGSDDNKFGAEAGKSALSSGQVRGKFGQEKPASDQTEQGLVAEAVRSDENAVIRKKNKTVSSPSPLSEITGNKGSEHKFGSDGGKFGLETGKSALSSGQVRGKSGLPESASEQAEQGLSNPEICPDENAVIRRKRKEEQLPLPSLTDQGGYTHG